MKRSLIATIFAVALLWAAPALAVATYNCNAITGGASRALDYMGVSDLNDGDRAMVMGTSGVTKYLYLFEYDSSGTTAENTGAHPYFVRPDDYATGGVWVEMPLSWVELAATLNITNLNVTNTLSAVNMAATGKLSGGVLYHRCKANFNPSGVTLYGGYITGVSEPEGQSGITNVVPSGTGTGENIVFFNERDTYTAGTTQYIHFTAGDTIRCNDTITAGTSKFILAGDDPWDQSVVCFSGVAGEWCCKTSGSPTVDWD